MKFTKIIKKEYFQYDGPVYDLMVDDSCSYNVDNLIVHNSGAGSLVCYLTNITRIADPLQYNLIFERFLNPDRKKLPDIDSDFCVNNGYKVYEHMNEKYGNLHCANVTAFQRMQIKSIIKDISRTLKIPFDESNKITSLLPDTVTDNEGNEKPIKLKDILALDNPDIKAFFKKYPIIVEYGLKFEGIPRSQSQHPAGIGVTPQEIMDITPVVPAKDSTDDNIMFLSVFEKENFEKMGIVKLDILRLKTVTDLQNMIKLVNKIYHKQYTDENIPLDDKKTWDFIKTGDTFGMFQFMSPIGFSVLKRVKPENLEELSACNAFIRPGASGIESYIAGKTGRDSKKYDPRIDEILKPTFGAITYQEQIMSLISILMGINFGQADLYRRALEKPNKNKDTVDEFNNTVIDKAVENGFTREVADEIRKQIIDNSAYGFNKCLSGDEHILGHKLSISQMYNTKLSKYYAHNHNWDKLHKKYNETGYGIGSSLNNDKFILNKVVDITYSGIMDTYIITTENGNSVKCTKNHKIPTSDGERLVSELILGDELYIYMDGNVKTSKITSIEYFGKEECFDVEMGHPYHNFVTGNGIVVCNSHAVCYAILAYQTAWMMVNYPLVFYTVMINGCSEKDLKIYLTDARRKGIKVNAPDINKSDYESTVVDNAIQIGFNALKGLGPSSAEKIKKARPIKTIKDLILNKIVNRGNLEVLNNVGALKDLYLSKDIKEKLIPAQLEKLLQLNEENNMTISNYEIPKTDIKGKYLSMYDFVFEKDDTVVIPENKLEEFNLKKDDYQKTRKKPKGFLQKATKLTFEELYLKNKELILSIYEPPVLEYIRNAKVLVLPILEHPCQKMWDKYPKHYTKLDSLEDGEAAIFMGIITDIKDKITKAKKAVYYLLELSGPYGNATVWLWENQFKTIKNQFDIQINDIIEVMGKYERNTIFAKSKIEIKHPLGDRTKIMI